MPEDETLSSKGAAEHKAPTHNDQHEVHKKYKKAPSKRQRAMFWITLIFVILALAWICLWIFYLRFYESTDDAYANGNLINVNSAIPGSVIAFYADDTDLVEQGQLLVRLDETDYKLKYEKELASLASVVLQVRQLYNNVHVNQAAVEARRAAMKKAKYDYDNRMKLIDSKAISNQDFTHSKDDLSISEMELKQAEYQLQIALDAAGNTAIEKHPLLEQQRENVRIAYYNLKHCSIYAPATGYIAQRTVNVGHWVNTTTDLMGIIPINYVWVDANFKETQLRKMRIGQPATVRLDIYGSGIKYQGKVLGIASGTGSFFSLIPPQNATGNWIKIVQRLPVRIALDADTVKKFPIRLGLSALVDVDISNTDLPMLARTPPKEPIAKTHIFDIDFEEVNKIIEEVIEANLYGT